VSERGDQAVTSLEMTGEEFVSFIQSLRSKAESMGLVPTTVPKPSGAKRPYTRRSAPSPAETAPVVETLVRVQETPIEVSPSMDTTILDSLTEARSVVAHDVPNGVTTFDPFGPDAL
jgi:hypothetical protein